MRNPKDLEVKAHEDIKASENIGIKKIIAVEGLKLLILMFCGLLVSFYLIQLQQGLFTSALPVGYAKMVYKKISFIDINSPQFVSFLGLYTPILFYLVIFPFTNYVGKQNLKIVAREGLFFLIVLVLSLLSKSYCFIIPVAYGVLRFIIWAIMTLWEK